MRSDKSGTAGYERAHSLEYDLEANPAPLKRSTTATFAATAKTKPVSLDIANAGINIAFPMR
jgi:hypothetical protein